MLAQVQGIPSMTSVVYRYDLPYSAYISRVFNFANFANLEPFAKLIQRKFWNRSRNSTKFWHLNHFGLELHVVKMALSSTLRRWMETIRGPSCLIHAERSRKKYPRLRYPQLARRRAPEKCGCGIFEERIREIISMKFSKTAIRENLDPRNISAIRYTSRFSLILDSRGSGMWCNDIIHAMSHTTSPLLCSNCSPFRDPLNWDLAVQVVVIDSCSCVG